MPLIPGVGAFQRKTQQLLLKALTHSGEPDQEIGERVMQYFPSSLQYGEPVNWSSEVPPGGTAPIHQWMSNGPDTLPLEIAGYVESPRGWTRVIGRRPTR